MIISRTPLNICICDPINIGCGESTSIKDAVKVILNACEYDVIPQYDENKLSAIPYRMPSTVKFKSIFGKKKQTSFRDGIKKTVEWYKSTMTS